MYERQGNNSDVVRPFEQPVDLSHHAQTNIRADRTAALHTDPDFQSMQELDHAKVQLGDLRFHGNITPLEQLFLRHIQGLMEGFNRKLYDKGYTGRDIDSAKREGREPKPKQ